MKDNSLKCSMNAQAEAVRNFREEEQREEEEYTRLFALARDESCEARELYGGENAEVLGNRGDEEEETYISPRFSRMDRQGNPTWIHIAPLERDARYDSINRDDPVAPEQSGEEAISGGNMQKRGERSSGWGSGQNSGASGIFWTRGGKGSRGPEADSPVIRARREAQGKGTLRMRPPSPLRGLMRMLFVTLVLGFVYHFVASMGWAPKLW